MGAITLDYATPPLALRNHLAVFYEFRADIPVFEDVERADLAQVRFVLSGSNGWYRFADGSQQVAPLIQIVGPTTGPTIAHIEGPVHLFGAGLLPSGWGAMLDFEASLLVNRVIDATELFGKGLYKRLRQLQGAATLDEKVAIGSEIGLQLIARGNSAAFDFARIVDDWLAETPSPDVDILVAATGLSRRQVERKCKACYGLPPKMLARKYRALKAAIAIAKNDAGSHDFLAEGFYDQSHFIRELKHFTGQTPTALATDLPMLATLTLKRTEMAGLSPLVTKV
jgi:AraC-like DNA-binding protein